MERILREIADQEIRLDLFLSRQMGLTRRQISQAKFRDNGICVNGVQRRIHTLLLPGDVVEIRIASGQDRSKQLVSTEGRLDVLWEDQDLLVVNKPAGLVTHPSHGHYQDTLANQVQAYADGENQGFRVRAMGRLDKDTSGLVIFAKNQVAAARLASQREKGILSKTYLALVSGRLKPPAGSISLPVRKMPGHLMKMEALPEGTLNAETSYRVLGYGEDFTAAEVKLQTGRTHQIRVHFSSLGYPLLGDPLYGPQDMAGQSLRYLSHTALHAWKLELYHPFKKTRMLLEAPIPDDLKRLLLAADETVDL